MRYKLLGIASIALLLFAAALATLFYEDIIDRSQTATLSNAEVVTKSFDYTQSGFSTNLPLVLVETKDGAAIDSTNPIWCDVFVINHGNGPNNALDVADTTVAATIRIRGNSSATFRKKSYRIECYKSQGAANEKDVPLLGMAAESDWILHAPYLDRTQIRNHLMYSVSREIMPWAPDSRYVELYVNGDYVGIYVLLESVKASPNRVALADYSLQTGETPYILQSDRWGSEQFPMNDFGMVAGYHSYPLTIKYPTLLRITEGEREWITKDISKVQRVLYSDYFDDPVRGYAAYIDVDSFVEYYLINEFSMSIDAGYWSTFYYKDLSGKLYAGPVWDFDNTFDNYVGEKLEPDAFHVVNNAMFARLMQDRSFVDAVCEKWYSLRIDILSEASLINRIRDDVLYLRDDINRNFSLYPHSLEFNMLDRSDDSDQIHSYEQAITQLTNCMIARGRFMDDHITALYSYCIN